MGKKKHHTKSHKSSADVLREMQSLARETRMADRSPWTAMALLACYAMLRCYGWNNKRLTKLMADINAYEDRWQDYQIEQNTYEQRLMDAAGWTVIYEPTTYSDFHNRKGTYDYAVDLKFMAAMNTINEHATRFFIWFYNVLIDNGFGSKRLEVVRNCVSEELSHYQNEKTFVEDWRNTLYNEAGLVFENPRDPLTGNGGSYLT